MIHTRDAGGCERSTVRGLLAEHGVGRRELGQARGENGLRAG